MSDKKGRITYEINDKKLHNAMKACAAMQGIILKEAAIIAFREYIAKYSYKPVDTVQDKQ